MAAVFIPFDGWTPSASYFGDGWSEVRNVYPRFADWQPTRLFVPVGAGVADGMMNGRHVHVWGTGAGTANYLDSQTLFTGSPTKLYEINPSTGAFADISRAAAYTANPAGWRFASVGTDVWAVNWVDVPQRRINNAGAFVDGVTSTFVPKPRFIATVREHLLGANLTNAGRFFDEVVWSDADNALNFDPPTGTSTSLAGAKRLTSIPGQIYGLVGGQYGLAFKRRATYYLEYSGPPAIFRADVLSAQVGTASPSSIIDSRYGVFFLGPDGGFWQIANLGAPQRISPSGLDTWLAEWLPSVATNPAWVTDIEMVGFQHPTWPIVGWLIGGTLSAGNVIALMYNPVTSTWSNTEINTIGSTIPLVIERPYASTPYEALAALPWDGATTKYAPWSPTGGSSVQTGKFQLRFRPANLETLHQIGQSLVYGILPVFSNTAVTTTPLSPTVTVEAMLDPFVGVYGAAEVRPPAERDTVAGYYPFQKLGRFFRITIECNALDFSNFEGCWVWQEPAT